ncbi:hypothetical protein VP1G_10768 [Cytospora mali]|uniref:Uncharacterized protein n=1 Tax=Cytospora mali TaxID=578113 RepID=A0A194UX29_CYTMA|nr:hypothetical protein VP1G_10768 [Valsa mali var. pyri (nom. inval.)]
MPNGPAAASISTIESILKPAEATGGQPGKSKCIECDGYECCCIPIPCIVILRSCILYSQDEGDIGLGGGNDTYLRFE